MKIIDAHHHLTTQPDNLERLAAECERLSVDKVCLFGAGRYGGDYGLAMDDGVRKAMEQCPDLIAAFACFDLGFDPPERVDDIVAQGFKGIKFINPTRNYDDKEFYPVYERMEPAGIPAIFHLGIVAHKPTDKDRDINNNRMRPIYLDTIARAFPDLNIVGAHLGNPWYEEATMSARWNPKLYFDLSGSTLKKKSARFLGDLLWWTPDTRYRDPEGRYAWEKIVFGSDVPPEEIEDVLDDYRTVMAELEVPEEIQAKVLGGTMARLLGIEIGR